MGDAIVGVWAFMGSSSEGCEVICDHDSGQVRLGIMIANLIGMSILQYNDFQCGKGIISAGRIIGHNKEKGSTTLCCQVDMRV